MGLFGAGRGRGLVLERLIPVFHRRHRAPGEQPGGHVARGADEPPDRSLRRPVPAANADSILESDGNTPLPHGSGGKAVFRAAAPAAAGCPAGADDADAGGAAGADGTGGSRVKPGYGQCRGAAGESQSGTGCDGRCRTTAIIREIRGDAPASGSTDATRAADGGTLDRRPQERR